jgi:hypothetical protein
LCRDRAIFGRILLDIGVQEVKLDPADLEFPDFGRNVSTQNRNGDVKRLIADLGFQQW